MHQVGLGLPWWLTQQRIWLYCGRPGLNPWAGKIPWRSTWQPTPVFLLEIPMDRGAWWATVHTVAKIGHDRSYLASIQDLKILVQWEN